jgi:hypothetical protein
VIHADKDEDEMSAELLANVQVCQRGRVRLTHHAIMNSQRGCVRLKVPQILIVTFIASALVGTQAAEPLPSPLFPGITPACSCESLTNVSLPNTIIESAVVDSSNHMCRRLGPGRGVE